MYSYCNQQRRKSQFSFSLGILEQSPLSIGQSIWDKRGKSGQKPNFPFTWDELVKTRTFLKSRPDRGRKRGRVRGNPDVCLIYKRMFVSEALPKGRSPVAI